MTQWRTLRNFDPWIVVAGLVLAFYGALLIYSASRTVYPDGIQGLGHPAVRHLVIATLGVIVVFAVAWLNYRTLGAPPPWRCGARGPPWARWPWPPCRGRWCWPSRTWARPSSSAPPGWGWWSWRAATPSPSWGSWRPCPRPPPSWCWGA